MMKAVKKSRKLDNVCYDIRGPVVEAADRMQREGIDIIMLNTGNTAPFNLMAPDEIVYDMKYNIKDAEGYSNSQGIFSARKAIVQHYQTKGIMDLTVDDVFLGNGASELILFCMQALLDDARDAPQPEAEDVAPERISTEGDGDGGDEAAVEPCAGCFVGHLW